MTNTAVWIRPLTEHVPSSSTLRAVHGSRCRTSQGMFAEWAASLNFPDYFGHSWDAFNDCLRDVMMRARHDKAASEQPEPALAVLVHEADELLCDEPPTALAILLGILSNSVGPDSDDPGLLLLLDAAPDRLPQVTERMTEAGFPPFTADH